MKKIIFSIVFVLLITMSLTAADMREQWRTGFIEGCVRENSPLAMCSCTADALLTKFHGLSVYEFSVRMMKGEMTAKDKVSLTEAVMECQPSKK